MGQLNSCCCGCTLAQGTVGTGIYASIRAILGIVVGVVLLQIIDDPEFKDYDLKLVRGIGIAIIVQASLALLVTQLLFVAVATQRKQFLFPWLIFYVIVFAFSVIDIILTISSGALNAGYTVGSLIGLAIMIYLYMVVLSYYKSFDRPNANTSVVYNQSGIVLNPGVTVQPPLVHAQQNPGWSAYSAPVQPYQAPPYSGPPDKKF